MIARTTKSLIPVERIEDLLQPEPALIIGSIVLLAWLVYKVLLRNATDERHRNLQALFRNLFSHTLFGSALYLLAMLTDTLRLESVLAQNMFPYVGLGALVLGSVVFVKTSKILMLEYLFLGHMREGVPLLLVNISTLLLSITIFGWFVTQIFGANLAPLLATSAVASIVLGLALQDTLGNLFAGISMQFDNPFEIGDWLEIQAPGQKIIGQVKEITWRSTVLVAFTDELITVPNRNLAQAQISNFSLKGQPIIRSQMFRIPYGADIDVARRILISCAASVHGVRQHPSPIAMISEASDSWILLKLVFYIDNYGLQYLLFDEVVTKALKELAKVQIEIAQQRVLIQSGVALPPKV
jgi:small-conductance mechanosensitive channel